MGKIKMFSGLKKCPLGEAYKFRKGIAIVPGFLFSGDPVHISINEFRQILKEIGDDVK